jgi:cytochrome c oxidase assembly protein subunit 19
MSRIQSKAPDKGSFPLDHFKECKKEVAQYNKCLLKFDNLPKRCRKYQKAYLECRMDNGLMEKESLNKLGFTDDLEWETEQEEKKVLFEKIQLLKKKAYDKVYNQENPKREENASN